MSGRAIGVDRTVLLWLLLLLALVVAYVLNVDRLPHRDSAAFIYVADGLLDGELPYVDRWDHKGPLVYVIDAVGRALTPDAFGGIVLLEAAWLVAWLLLGVAALRPAFGTVASLFAMTVVIAAAIRLMGRGGNWVEEWALLPQFVAIYLFARVQRGDLTDRRFRAALVAIGATGAAALLLRPNLIGVWLAIGLTWLLFGDRRWAKIGWASWGGLMTLLVSAELLLLSGAWPAFLDAVFDYNTVYSGAGGLAGALANLGTAWAALPLAIPAALAWVWAAWVALRPGELGAPALGLIRLAVLLAPLELLLIAVSGRTFSHYYLAVLPVLAILGAFLARRALDLIARVIELLTRSIERRVPDQDVLGRLARMASPGVILLAVALVWSAVVTSEAVGRTSRSLTGTLDKSELGPWERVAGWIETATEPGDPVLVWGSEPQLYLLSGRESPSRFFYQFALFTDGYADSALGRDFVEELLADPPAVVIDTFHKWQAPVGSVARERWEPQDDGYTSGPGSLRRFYQMVERDYERGPAMLPWRAWVRRPDVEG